MSDVVSIEVVEGIDAIDAEAWNRLVSPDDPFTDHAFLSALEKSESVGPEAGWLPCHVVARRNEAFVGAVPLYLKSHSYGEYIFDWGWAGAAQRWGLPYFPRLVAAVPFTPATGRRILVEDGAVEGPVFDALVAGVRAVAEQTKAQSIHFLFLTSAERLSLSRSHGFLPRLTFQFHWRNPGDATFDDHVGRMRSAARKQVLRERRQAAECGLDISLRTGESLEDAHWDALYRLYQNTIRRKGAIAYLQRTFFEILRETCPERVLVAMAQDGDRCVAASLSFEKGRHLYGRYWGAFEPHPGLHFELCYHRLIERAIGRGLDRFEAGAQGPHKIKRGLLPAATHSAHWIRHPGLAHAVSEHVHEETRAAREEMEALKCHSPFRQGVDV